MTLLLVLLGGAVGAPLRYLTDRFVQSRHDSVFPWGTLTVNGVGSLLLGGLAGAVAGGALPEWVLPLLGAGLCGALTTFSTFGYETVRLVQGRSVLTAAVNVGVSVLVAVAGCAGAYSLALALTT